MGGGWLVRFGAVLAFGALASCGGTPLGCRHSCLATAVELVVTDSTGGAINTVQATLSNSNPITEPRTMSCEPGAGGTRCTSPAPSGSYSLQVTAPGFQTATVPATVTLTSEPTCGCAEAALDPASLTLAPL